MVISDNNNEMLVLIAPSTIRAVKVDAACHVISAAAFVPDPVTSVYTRDSADSFLLEFITPAQGVPQFNPQQRCMTISSQTHGFIMTNLCPFNIQLYAQEGDHAPQPQQRISINAQYTVPHHRFYLFPHWFYLPLLPSVLPTSSFLTRPILGPYYSMEESKQVDGIRAPVNSIIVDSGSGKTCMFHNKGNDPVFLVDQDGNAAYFKTAREPNTGLGRLFDDGLLVSEQTKWLDLTASEYREDPCDKAFFIKVPLGNLGEAPRLLYAPVSLVSSPKSDACVLLQHAQGSQGCRVINMCSQSRSLFVGNVHFRDPIAPNAELVLDTFDCGKVMYHSDEGVQADLIRSLRSMARKEVTIDTANIVASSITQFGALVPIQPAPRPRRRVLDFFRRCFQRVTPPVSPLRSVMADHLVTLVFEGQTGADAAGLTVAFVDKWDRMLHEYCTSEPGNDIQTYFTRIGVSQEVPFCLGSENTLLFPHLALSARVEERLVPFARFVGQFLANVLNWQYMSMLNRPHFDATIALPHLHRIDTLVWDCLILNECFDVPTNILAPRLLPFVRQYTDAYRASEMDFTDEENLEGIPLLEGMDVHALAEELKVVRLPPPRPITAASGNRLRLPNAATSMTSSRVASQAGSFRDRTQRRQRPKGSTSEFSDLGGPLDEELSSDASSDTTEHNPLMPSSPLNQLVFSQPASAGESSSEDDTSSVDKEQLYKAQTLLIAKRLAERYGSTLLSRRIGGELTVFGHIKEAFDAVYRHDEQETVSNLYGDTITLLLEKLKGSVPTAEKVKALMDCPKENKDNEEFQRVCRQLERVIDTFSTDELAQLMQFWTSSCVLPLSSASDGSFLHVLFRLPLHEGPSDANLPKSNTCFRDLILFNFPDLSDDDFALRLRASISMTSLEFYDA